MKRDEVLDTAKELINGSRARDYGDAFDNFKRISVGWNVIIKEATKDGGELDVGGLTLVATWVRTDSFTKLSNKD